ncbi:hypothetical protein SALBM311S_12198 [Streptomyces alboniger]
MVGSAGLRKLGETAKPPTNGHVRIGSNTKTLTATAVLQLVAEGTVGLDAPVADFLPEFGLDPKITVRMLLQHTSGVFNFTGEYYDDGTFAPGIPATTAGQEWVDNPVEDLPAGRAGTAGVVQAGGLSRGRTGATPTPTTCWPGC